MGHTVEQHFERASEEVRDIYDTLLALSRKFGNVDEDPKKTSIHLNRKSAFAGIATRKESLILTIKSKLPINSSRIRRSEQASANRWHHEIPLSSPDEIDSELIDWLKQSYEMSG